ncbi:MAG: histidinol-phosphatase [Solobacterium sp.]|nr:histidinol-phosphatase [Solobacterium sp.]
MAVRTDFSSMHNHTVFADGKNTVGEMVQAAYEQGVKHFGISEHSPFPAFPEGGMRMEDVSRYAAEMRQAQEEYRGRMEVYAGLEQDIDSPAITENFDYVIGSVHFIQRDGRYYPVDYSEEIFLKILEEVFRGEIHAFVQEYYRRVSEVVKITDCDIIGHFDLITKYNENDRLFRTDDEFYRTCVRDALDVLIPENRIFEVNSGAISRGYRKTPYPQKWILEELCKRRAKITLNADAHHRENILFGYDEMINLVKECGFTEIMVMSQGTWIPVKL